MNRSWESLLPSHKPNFSLDYLGLICLGVDDGCEGVCWRLQLLIPEESQGAKNMSTSPQHLQGSSWGSPQGCGGEETGWLNSAILGKTGFLVAIAASFLISWSVLLLHKASFCFFHVACPKWDSLLLISKLLFCFLSNLFIQMGLKFRGSLSRRWVWLLNGNTHIECWIWCTVFPGIVPKCMHT